MRAHFIGTEPLGREPHPSRAAIVGRVGRIVDYLFGVLYALLLIRFMLDFFNARREAGFVQLIRHLSDGIFAPFRGIVTNSNVAGQPVVWSLLVAVLVYMLVHAAIRGLLRLLA